MTNAQEVKSRLDVVTLVQSYIKLDKAGVNFKARCPFHSEKTPSFYVSPTRETWHCFGCGKGGDIFQFVMEMDGLDFPEALRMLAERAGVELAHFDVEARSNKTRLYEILEAASDFFEKNLSAEKEASAYLSRRGVTPQTIKKFRLGFAPDGWRVTGEYLRRAGYTDSEIEKAGLSVEGSRGPYDRFRSRIIFPLEDVSGRVIGFGGRIFPPDSKKGEGAKYINTPQTALYDKSRYLYSFDKAKTEIRTSGKALVVEGYLDAILSYQAGASYTVAVSGTALTQDHLRLLRRLAGELIFAFDMDHAGIAASRRAVELAYKEDFHVQLVDIDGGKDPADVVLKDPKAWIEMVKNAKESVAFFLEKALGTLSPSDVLAKKKIAEIVLPLVSRLQNEIEKAHWTRELSRILKVTEEAIWKELGKYKQGGASEATLEIPLAQEPRELTRKARLEERIIGWALLEPRLMILGDLPLKADCSLLATGELSERLQKDHIHAIQDEFFKSLPDDLRHEAERYLFETEVAAETIEHREEEFLALLYAWRELSLKEKLTNLHSEIERLEALGKKEETQLHVKKFQELTQHLASVISLHSKHYDKKIKKEKF